MVIISKGSLSPESYFKGLAIFKRFRKALLQYTVYTQTNTHTPMLIKMWSYPFIRKFLAAPKMGEMVICHVHITLSKHNNTMFRLFH